MDKPINQKKLELIQWLVGIEDEELLDSISHVKEYSLTYGSSISEKERDSLAKGLADADAGLLTSHEKVMASYAKYL